MTDKHTPRPWMQLTGPNGHTYITNTAGPHWASHCIAEVKEDADARLIAAAPELLSALKAARDELLVAATRAGDDDYWNKGGQGHAVYSQVVSIIEAAKGDA